MKKVLIISLFLTFLFQVKSQNTEVEIYMVQSNTIVKGTVVASSTDSLSIRVDSLNSLTFAKSELEGRDFPVSKEVKRLRRKLAISESKKLPNSFPGIFQICKGQKLKGGIMFILTSAGIIGVVAPRPIGYAYIQTNKSWRLSGRICNPTFSYYKDLQSA